MIRAIPAVPGAIACALLLVARPGAAPPPARTATIEIEAGTVAGQISPVLYGQFLEFMFEGIKRGLHGELLRNRSFDEPPNAIGLSRSWERYPDDRNDDYGISFSQDPGMASPEPTPDAPDGTIAPRSLRIELRPAVLDRHGFYQSGVPVKRGIEYHGSLWMKADSFSGQVTVALERDVSGGRVYAQAQVTAGGDRWTQRSFTLRPETTDPLARFVVLVSGSGTLWIDQLSLLPGTAVDGVRADVFDRVKALAPAFVRWPGGNVAQDYHWRWGVGPRDERPTWTNLSWKNEPEPSDFGTDEFIRFARNVGAQPSITVNVEGRGATAEEAAAWVDYCNGPATSKYGAMRARNGHPTPYGVRYWEIGNEIWGDWVRGHSDAATYARNFTRYVAAMRAVDPSIRVIAVGDNDMAWNRTVLRLAGERPDYLAIHHYYSRRDMDGDVLNLMARPLHYERLYEEIDAAWREFPPDRRPRLAINEWGLDLPQSQQYSVLGALYGARLMNVFERHGDLVAMSAVSDLVNGWPGGIIQAGRQGMFVTPTYLVNALYATHLGTERLTTRVDGPTFSSTREGAHVPVLDVVASRSPARGKIFLKIVNTDLERPVQARLTIRGATVSRDAIVDRVVTDSLTAVTDFSTPGAVRSVRGGIEAGRQFTLELPRHSVSVVTLSVVK